MKKIWMINQYAIPPALGGGTRHFSLAKRLTKLDFDVSLIASKDHHLLNKKNAPTKIGVETLMPGLRFYWLKLPSYKGSSFGRIWNMLFYAAAVIKLALFPKSLGKPDVIWGSSPHLFGAFAGLLVARYYRIPFLLEIRDLWPQTFIDLGAYTKHHPFVLGSLWIEKYLYRHADWIITLLEGSQEHIVEKGADPNRISVISNGIDLDFIGEVNLALTDQRKNSEFLCIYGGAFGLANAIDTIVDAARIIEQEYEAAAIRFELYGEGPEKHRLQKKIDALGLKSISFAGSLSKKEIYKKYVNADLLLECKQNTNLYRWGLSFNKLYDYLASARPILIAIKARKNPVVLAQAGLEVEPENPRALAESILRLKSLSSEEREAMGRRGRDYVLEHYDFDKLAEKAAGVLKHLRTQRVVQG